MATTIRVERRVVEELEEIKKKTGLKSLNDVVDFLIRQYKTAKLEQFFGIDKKRISKYTEGDRLEDRG